MRTSSNSAEKQIESPAKGKKLLKGRAKTVAKLKARHGLDSNKGPLAFLTPANKPIYLTQIEQQEHVINHRLQARKLGKSMMRRWHARLDLEELDSVVDLSLCEAVKKFNPAIGASFITFLFYHLRGNLIRTITAAASFTMVPLFDQDGALIGEGDTDKGLGNRHANAIEIAQALSGNDYTLPDEAIFKKEIVDISVNARGRLDPLAREVIERIFMKGQQLLDIAGELGYSRCHISRVKRRALETLFDDVTKATGETDRKRPDFGYEENPGRRGAGVIHRAAKAKFVHRRKRGVRKESSGSGAGLYLVK